MAMMLRGWEICDGGEGESNDHSHTHTLTLWKGGRTVYSAIKVRRKMGRGERREERVRRRKKKGGVG